MRSRFFFSTVKQEAEMLSFLLNFGGQGAAPGEDGWIDVWGEPYVDADLTSDVTFSDVGGSGIDVLCINNSHPNCWGELGNSALGNAGEAGGPYPAAVNTSYWFVSNRTGVLRLSGSVLDGKTWTVRLFASRSNSGGATGPRVTEFIVNGGTEQTVNAFQNTSTKVEFTGVTTDTDGYIEVSVSFGTQFGYLNAMELIQTS